MSVLVTAFGPFNGRLENASSLVLKELKRTFPKIRTRILAVDSVIAPARLKQALRSIRPESLIMLGEAAGSKKIRLETTAWNELDFRIPDIAGRLVTARPIRKNSPASLRSTLPLEQIYELLDAAGHQVSYSDDPGRYLCNQLFYAALDHLKRQSIVIPAGFIHLPLENECSTTSATDAISRIIQMLTHPPGESPA